MELTYKQTAALDYLEDNTTTDLLFGGAAGGGKSIIGSYWLLKNCYKYNDTRWLMGRSELKTLKETTLVSFFKVCAIQGIRANVDYKFNQASNTIHFRNKSVILLKDLFAYPSDPNFDSLGSLEITGGFIDECNQITEKAKNIVRSRIRHNLDAHKLIPKLFLTCNPAKNWVYKNFYRPFRDNLLSEDMKFIQALVTDNDKIEKSYIENLRKLDPASQQRLLFGNWEYDDDPSVLITFDKILDCFTNDFASLKGEKYIIADIARFGSDSIIIGTFDGFRVKIKKFNKQATTETARYIDDERKGNNIPMSHVVVDSDGVGGGVADMLPGCINFVNNARPLPEPAPDTQFDTHGDPMPANFDHVKSQCYFRLADRVNKNGLFIECDDPEMRENIIQELEQVKQWKMDKDGKRRIIPKDEVKALIRRSPDYTDMLAMREYPELTPKFSWVGF